MGEGLFELLLPTELQQLYWEQIEPLLAQGAVKTLLINSDEPWIPWELIKPYRYNEADHQCPLIHHAQRLSGMASCQGQWIR